MSRRATREPRLWTRDDLMSALHCGRDLLLEYRREQPWFDAAASDVGGEMQWGDSLAQRFIAEVARLHPYRRPLRTAAATAARKANAAARREARVSA